MQNYKYILILILLPLSACANNIVVGTQDRTNAIAICYDKAVDYQAKPEFLNDGHLYTTLVVTDIAKFPLKRQLVLSYYTQYPDLDRDVAATPVALKYFLVPWRYSWRNNITGELHSLHGGNSIAIQKRRTSIRSAINESLKNPENDWLSGLLVHAYGDSFAHTKNAINTAEERAYGVWFGHAWESLNGRSPDDIKLNQMNEDKYLSYLREFYSTVKENNSTDKKFNEFKDFVDDLECPTGRCPNFHAEYNDQDPKDTRIDIFVDCMNKTSRQLTELEIAEVFKKID